MSNEVSFFGTELFARLAYIQAILEQENLTKTASLLAQQRQIVGDLYAALADMLDVFAKPHNETLHEVIAARAALARARGEV